MITNFYSLFFQLNDISFISVDPPFDCLLNQPFTVKTRPLQHSAPCHSSSRHDSNAPPTWLRNEGKLALEVLDTALQKNISRGALYSKSRALECYIER